MNVTPSEQTRNPFDTFVLVLYLTALFSILYFFIDGLDFYLTPLSGRPRHADYWSLKPGGIRSHGFGVIGSILMLLLLLYSVRKRTRIFGVLGMMSRWLKIHIYMGITGPLLIVLHSTFKLNGIVAVSFWSMIAVVGSGVLGRYLYALIPKNVAGIELQARDVETKLEELGTRLRKDYNISADQQQKIIRDIDSKSKPSDNLFRLFFGLLITDITGWIRRMRIRTDLKKLPGIDSANVSNIIRLLKEKAHMERRLQLWKQIHRMFYYWHVFHKPFAIIMYFIMMIHIGISIWLGYTWIF